MCDFQSPVRWQQYCSKRYVNTDYIYQTSILLVDGEKDVLYAFESLLKYEGDENIKAYCDSKDVLKSFEYMEVQTRCLGHTYARY